MVNLLNSLPLIESFGLLGIYFIIFAESGLFFGFFFPGDSLLFTAGLLSSEGRLSFWALIIGAFMAGVLGNQVGYLFGKRVGAGFFPRPDSLFFNQKYIQETEKFFDRHGNKTIILARFVPIVRTFAPIMAGVGKMKFVDFFRYNLIGGALWTVGISSLGYFLGRSIPNIDHYLLPIIALIIIISFLPPFFQYLKWRKDKAKI